MKKDSRRKRGTSFQLWCKKWIEETYPGSMVHNQPMNHICVGPGKWICVSNDIFGCIDLIAMEKNKAPLYIQVTCDHGITRKLEKLMTVPWNLELMRVQVWVKRSPTRVSIKELGPEHDDDDNVTYKLVDYAEINRRKYERV